MQDYWMRVLNEVMIAFAILIAFPFSLILLGFAAAETLKRKFFPRKKKHRSRS